MKANTRSWGEAEEVKRRLDDQLSGRVLDSQTDASKNISACISVFLQDKKVQGVGQNTIDKHRRELDRLRDYCERKGVFVVQELTREERQAEQCYHQSSEDWHPRQRRYPPKVAEELRAIKNEGPYIFWDGESDIVKSWTKYVITPCFESAEIEKVGTMVSHRLRDTFAVHLLENGVPLEEVSKALGHKSVKTTEEYYAKWVKGRQDKLDSLIMSTW